MSCLATRFRWSHKAALSFLKSVQVSVRVRLGGTGNGLVVGVPCLPGGLGAGDYRRFTGVRRACRGAIIHLILTGVAPWDPVYT